MKLRAVLALSLIAIAAVASEPPKDTVFAKYVITRADTSAFQSQRLYNNHRRTVIVVPKHAKPGDTLLVAELWEGVPDEYVKAREQADEANRELQDLKAMMKTLDSLGVKKGKP